MKIDESSINLNMTQFRGFDQTKDSYLESAIICKTSSTLEIPHCNICFNKYDDDKRTPLLLPCGHTFCKACCKKLLEPFDAQNEDDLPDNEIKCPVDSHKFQLVDERELAKNY